ncbi:hypothetical protein GOP47_0030606 [Adiantum capillus-veneris]|nr:hypothetical protein GOP47_0030606 [Adiantum capillus-veneris]
MPAVCTSTTYLCMDHGGQSFSFGGHSGQIIGSEDREVWIGSGSFSDPLRSSSSTMMPTSQRRKRQNCGSSTQGHHSIAHDGTGQLGLGAMVAEESPSHLGPVFAGAPRVMNHGGRLNSRSLQFNGFEPGNSTTARFPYNDGAAADGGWNALPPGLTLGPPVSNSVGIAANSSYTYAVDQSRNSYKRKSSMDTYPGSSTHATSSGVGENSFLRFTQGPGARRPDISLSRESGVRRDGQGAYYSVRTNALPVNRYDGLTATMTQDNHYCPSIILNERDPRRMVSRSDAINGLSATVAWRRNSTLLEEGSNQSGLFETMRNFNPSMEGNHLRRGEASEMMDVVSIDTRSHQPSSRALRPAQFREFPSQPPHVSHHLAPNPYAYVGTINIHAPSYPAAQSSSRFNNIYNQVVLPPPGVATTISGLTSGPQAAFGDLPSASVHGQFLPRYNDNTNRASFLRQASLRGSRVLPPDGVTRHRFSASHHELSNQALAYEWADAYDQHSDMRLDVDNMSYEELLALEERIGNVNTGLNEDEVKKCLKVSMHSCSDVAVMVNSQECDSKCSVCQEEYMEGDELGELQCGHGYHTDCIKQWLLVKNQCPICKAAAS